MSERFTGGVTAVAERPDAHQNESEHLDAQARRSVVVGEMADAVLSSPDFNFSDFESQFDSESPSPEALAIPVEAPMLPGAVPELDPQPTQPGTSPAVRPTPARTPLAPTPTVPSLPATVPFAAPPAPRDLPTRTLDRPVMGDDQPTRELPPVSPIDNDSPRDTPPPVPEVPPTDERDRTPDVPQFTVVALDMTRDAENYSLDIADKQLTAELNAEGRGFFKKGYDLFIKGGVAKDIYRWRYAKQARREMDATGNVYTGVVSEADRETARNTVFDRFGTNLDIQEVISTAAGERRDVHEQDSPLAAAMKNNITRYVLGEIPRDEFLENDKRIINDYHDSDPNTGLDAKGKARADALRTSNTLATAEGIKTAVDHGASLENIIQNMQIATGETALGARTEARRDVIDKWTKRFSGSALVPEAVAVTAAVGVNFLTRLAPGIAGKVLGITTPGVLGAAVGAVRGYRSAKQEVAQHARERAMGGVVNAGDRRRERLEETIVASRDNTEIIDTLQAGLDGLATIDTASINNALLALSMAEALEGARGVDLQRKSGHLQENAETVQKGILRAQLKVALRREMATLGRDFDAELRNEAGRVIEEDIRTEVSRAAAAARKYQRREAAKGAAIGAATGLGTAIVLQEAMAMIPDTAPFPHTDTQGLVEQLWQDQPTGTHETVLADVFNVNASGYHPEASTSTDYKFGAESKNVINVTDDHKLVMSENGSSFNLVDGSGKTAVENLAINEDGSFPQSTIDELHKHGMDVEATPFKDPDTVTTKNVGMDEYLAAHQDERQHISRSHFHNGSPSTPNGSELGLHRTGTGYVPGDGSFHMNISNMDQPATDGRGNSINWSEEAAKGEVYLAVSPSVDEQSKPFLVPFNSDGTVNINADNPAAPFLGVDAEGRLIVTGGYAEAIHVSGETAANGAMKVDVLATVVGTNEAANGQSFTVSETVPGKEYAGYTINAGGYTVPKLETEIPIPVPIVPRRSIENIGEEERPAPTPPVEPTPEPAPTEVIVPPENGSGGPIVPYTTTPEELELPPPSPIRATAERLDRTQRAIGPAVYESDGRGGRRLAIGSMTENGVYRNRGLGREYLTPDAPIPADAARRALTGERLALGPAVGGENAAAIPRPERSTGRQKPRKGSAPGGGRPGNRPSAQPRVRSRETLNRIAQHLTDQLNNGELTPASASPRANINFGRKGFAILNLGTEEAPNYRVVVNEDGIVFGQQTRAQRVAALRGKNSTPSNPENTSQS